MASKRNFSLSIDDDLLLTLRENNKNISKYINECISLRMAEVKFEDVIVIQKYLKENPNKIKDFSDYIKRLINMLEDL